MNDIEYAEYWQERALAAEKVIDNTNTNEQATLYKNWRNLRNKSKEIKIRENISEEGDLKKPEQKTTPIEKLLYLSDIKEILKWFRTNSIAFAAFSFSAVKLDGTVCTEDDLIDMWKNKNKDWQIKKTIIPPKI